MARPCFKLEKVHPDPVAGVDEAGCAPLAGPVVAAAVILDRNRFPRGIDDSKALPAPVREAICARLYKVAVIGVGIASVEEIDTLNIYWARMLAMSRAVDALGIDPAMVLVDGNRCPRWERPSLAIVEGDAKCRSIAAASIVNSIPVMAGSATRAIRPPSMCARWPRSGRRRSTAAASRRSGNLP
jgi:ribonuclease HII